MLLMALQSNDVNMETGTSGVMGTTATVARFDAMCFLVSWEPAEEGGGEGNEQKRSYYGSSHENVLAMLAVW